MATGVGARRITSFGARVRIVAPTITDCLEWCAIAMAFGLWGDGGFALGKTNQ